MRILFAVFVMNASATLFELFVAVFAYARQDLGYSSENLFVEVTLSPNCLRTRLITPNRVWNVDRMLFLVTKIFAKLCHQSLCRFLSISLASFSVSIALRFRWPICCRFLGFHNHFVCVCFCIVVDIGSGLTILGWFFCC